MLRGLWAMAVVCALAAGGTVSAQQRTGYRPAEIPPPTFTGRQYVDSRGCAFIRTGFGGQVTWVPRLTLQKQPVCGLAPSLGGGRVAAAALAPPASLRPTVSAPVAVPMTGRLAGCPADAPFGQRVVATDGRRGLLCTATPAQVVSGPVAVAQAVPALVSIPVPPPAQTGPLKVTVTPPMTVAARPVVPPSYRPVWTDDRLNPHRGGRSAAGRVAMATVWTDTVPRRLVDPNDKGLGPVAGQMRVSTRSAPAMAGQFVQVGVFGETANAIAAAARLAALGLPVRRVRRGAGESVLAGPFADPSAARAALIASRAAGFADAYLRR